MLRNRSTLVKLEKKIFITIIFTIMCTTRRQQRCGCMQRCLQPRMGSLRWFRCNRIVLRIYWHRPVAWFPRRRLGRQSKYGRRRGNLGGSTMVDLALSTCVFSPPDTFADSYTCLPLPSMLSMRGCKSIGWEGVWDGGVNLEEPVRVASPTRINLEEPISSGYPAHLGLIRSSVRHSVIPSFRL
jgi:hypothetical protein